jgi:hypothetical protein
LGFGAPGFDLLVRFTTAASCFRRPRFRESTLPRKLSRRGATRAHFRKAAI